ncbi:GAF and ANTAR domain-containing protein [Modestobacter altitudinis]|uniref:GAF and ANTAR domain-containing protein n=1 Tax=Modestobacter altitudinis TaxID=2213158 RepID=UPI001FE9E8FD|nr:GAF and ANTAR domain-containing protein [Modestobacter altitudinis]
MTLIEQFRTALAASSAQMPGPELLPERLARACARALPVDGAGISLFFADDRRLPLGASDAVSAEAERLQFTVGEGPCLAAHAEGRPLMADEATIRSRWPAFYDCLASTTPIRATLSLPLEDDLRDIGALDLYLVPPRDPGALSLADAVAVTHEVAAAFAVVNERDRGHADGPAWLDAPAAGRRATVWQAIGMVNAALRLASPDALAVLRAHAYATGTTLDDLSARLVDRQVPMTELSFDVDRSR